MQLNGIVATVTGGASGPGDHAPLVESIVVVPMLDGEAFRLDGAIRMAPR